MGQQLTYLQRPVTDKESENGFSENGIAYAVSSMQGWRRNMEDAHVADIHFSSATNSVRSAPPRAITTTTTTSDAAPPIAPGEVPKKEEAIKDVDMEASEKKEEENLAARRRKRRKL